MDYCSFDSFINPDIRPFVASLTGFDVTETNVPVTTLDSDEVKRVITELAAAFFGTVLPRTDKSSPTLQACSIAEVAREARAHHRNGRRIHSR